VPDVHAQRHHVLYPEFFAGFESGAYPLTRELFTKVWRQKEVDPRWLRVHVHKAAPSSVRPTWLYVTCGLSDPDPTATAPPEEGLSGLGCEFKLETSEDTAWPMVRLQEVAALQLLLGAGRFGDCRLLEDEDLLPLHQPITRDGTSALRWLLVATGGRRPYAFQLPTGLVRFCNLLGITNEEAVLAQQVGAGNLIVLLERNGFFPLVAPERTSVVIRRSPSAS